MKYKAYSVMVALFSVVIMLISVPVFAAEAPTEEVSAEESATTEVAVAEVPTTEAPAPWQFEFTPYFFASGLSGKTTVKGVTADVDMGFDDILDNLDAGFMAMFEARKGRWSFLLDGVYFKLKKQEVRSATGPLGNTITSTLDATFTEQVYSLSVGYRVIDDRVKVDAIGAVRGTLLDSQMGLTVTTDPPILPDGSRSISGDRSWIDPVVGARILWPFAKKWTAVGYGDIGGFGIGSDLTAQLLAGVNWQFSKVVSAKLGYRYLYQDYKQDDFAWDMTSNGFYLGAGFRF